MISDGSVSGGQRQPPFATSPVAGASKGMINVYFATKFRPDLNLGTTVSEPVLPNANLT